MRSLHLWPEGIAHLNGMTTLSATVEYPDQQRSTLWYRLPESYGHLLSQSCDAFAIALLFTVMKESDRLVIHGQVSPSLLRNLEEFQAAWHCWCPQVYSPVTIEADIEQESDLSHQQTQAISMFSGGVDSCFTAFRHYSGSCKRLQQNLQASLMVHGFDISIEEPEVFERALLRSKTMLSSLGIELIPLATNFRRVMHSRWVDTFATALGSCLSLFQDHYSVGLIPASFSYHSLKFPFGSNPVTDALLSSRHFSIIHDGALASRSEKIRTISEWPEAIENLRVCWEGPEKDRNCGRCEKCIRNILNFRVIGLNSPACFDRSVTDPEIIELKVDVIGLKALQNVLRDARAANIKASWVEALEACIENNQYQETLKVSQQGREFPDWKEALRPLKRYLQNKR